MSRKTIYFVLGEDSGDALGADLYHELMEQAAAKGQEIDVIGLAGPKLIKEGMTSLFDIEQIAVMGVSAVVGRLPTIVRRIYQTVSDIVARKPDMIVLIDSPDFTHAVAKRVRKQMPNVPIINYVCPSVWAWRSGRAKTMRAYVDHVLALLPFEPQALKDLDGPSATYVGHPLAWRMHDEIENRPVADSAVSEDEVPVLLILPGSRTSEVKRMLKPFEKTLEIMKERGIQFKPVLPAVPHLKSFIQGEVASWAVRPEVVDSADNDKVFATARAALAASGTVALQLALHRVPMVAAYKLDPMTAPFHWLITIWSSNLPNLITDRVLVPEEFNKLVRPGRLARYMEELMSDTVARQRQLEGFDIVAERMQTDASPGSVAAACVLERL
ncbi:MAG: lipid-A-disaccharide synthase [Pseudomonadota bacterium]